MLPCLQAHDHDDVSVLWIVYAEAVCLLVVLPHKLSAVGIICLWGTCTCWDFGGIRESRGLSNLRPWCQN